MQGLAGYPKNLSVTSGHRISIGKGISIGLEDERAMDKRMIRKR
jgi:hypothetical protein